MVGSYSPSSDLGGTLHLPSPTHIHHVDPASAFRQLRHSLSRSPSKGLTHSPSKFRLVTSKSTSPSPSSPLSPSRDPPHRSISASIISEPHTLSQSPLAVPYPPSARKLRPATRKLSPLRHPMRSTSVQRSPKKRTLGESTTHGNSTPQSSAGSGDDQENRVELSLSPKEDIMPDVIFKPCTPAEETSPFAPARATAKFEKGNSWGAKSSPLKRSDGIMNLDRANLGSPSRKRRSLHAGMFSSDFNIFDHEAAVNGGEEVSSSMDMAMDMDTNTRPEHHLALPKRTSSLRKTTLQQRHDKPLFARSKPNTDLALDFATPSQASHKSRFRMSLDSVLPPSVSRDSPFSSQGSLPNASCHPLSQYGAKPNALVNVSQPQRHPLSRTISQSTSNSSMAEDSPTHIPIRQPESRRPLVDFSRSLPVGAPRPASQDGEWSSQATSGTSFATPENYKLVKPLPAAFMSTGLISKRHKDMDEPHPNFGASRASMPDTPCKRHSLAEIPSPTVPQQDSFAKSHHARHSFCTPSTPFSTNTSRIAPRTLGKGVSIFGSSCGVARRASFLSVDGDDYSQSPPKQGDSQSSNEFEFPPTPTKQVLGSEHAQQPSFGASVSRDHVGSPGYGASTAAHPQSEEDDRYSSPVNCHQHLSPHTPRESMIPPDPSGLTISAHANDHPRPMSASMGSTAMYPPATPTASKDSSIMFNNSTASMTPSHGPAPIEVDPVLTSKFDKVELIGTGEFSQVYKVMQKQELRSSRNYFSNALNRISPKSTLPDRVWAVKKSRNAYIGPRDRQRKLQEVNTLKALGQSDHTLNYFDSWEVKNHLYIQTEFCEEGSLDMFLNQVGRKARLDDFRIWKIMLELSLGLKHIHDSGFIHLDLKPANVLITFEGLLKIADFGMATCWPAQPGIEGEGDREYIGPEILMGHFDKPADVFALGLIMLEIAGNVMLPDNGASWQRLRSGDMSDVPSLTWSSDTSNILRDSAGKPHSQEETIDDFYGSDSGDDDFGAPDFLHHKSGRSVKSGPFALHRSGELAQPPAFMIDQHNPEALDNLVRWMITPQAADRPLVHQILSTTGVRWAEDRRRAGATIFEGNWGPADEVLADDAEMIDV